jgi:hypothetical protein
MGYVRPMRVGSGRLNESLPTRIFISYRRQKTAWLGTDEQ